MMSHQKGFTLIELVAVIVILGTLAVVALPRFLDLQDEANEAAIEGVAGALSSAYAINYAASLTKDSSVSFGTTPGVDQFVVVGGGSSTNNASDTDTSLLTDAPLDGNYSINTGCDGSSTSSGDTLECTLTDDDDSSVTTTFTVIFTQ